MCLTIGHVGLRQMWAYAVANHGRGMRLVFPFIRFCTHFSPCCDGGKSPAPACCMRAVAWLRHLGSLPVPCSRLELPQPKCIRGLRRLHEELTSLAEAEAALMAAAAAAGRGGGGGGRPGPLDVNMLQRRAEDLAGQLAEVLASKERLQVGAAVAVYYGVY